MSTFGERLRELRKAKNYTAEQVGQTLGVTRRAYVNYESGHREPTIDQLVKLAALFGVSLDYLVGLTGTPEKSHETLPPGPVSWRSNGGTIEDTLLEEIRTLTPEQQKQVGQFIRFLKFQGGDQEAAGIEHISAHLDSAAFERTEAVRIAQMAAHMEAVYGIASPQFRVEIADVVRRTRDKYRRMHSEEIQHDG